MPEATSPTKGPSPESIDQQHMVVPASDEAAGKQETHDARSGGNIYTCGFSESETRRPELHGAVAYQEETSTDGKPEFIRYTDLTTPKGDVRG